MNHSPSISCVVYGSLSGEKVRGQFVSLVEMLSKNLNLTINAIAKDEKGFRYGDDIFAKFQKTKKYLRANGPLGFQCKVDISVPGDYNAYFHLNESPSSIGVFIKKEIFSEGKVSLINVLSTLASDFLPEYGYASENWTIDYPELYAVGINSKQTLGFSGEAYEESLSISRWSSIGMRKQVYRLGYLRDIYEYNLLNRQQCARKIENCTLESWIHGKGIVKKVNDNLLIWQIPFCDISSIRDALRRAKLIFDWRNFSESNVN